VEKIDIFTDYIYLKYDNGEWEKCPASELGNMKCVHCAEKPSLEIANAKGGDNDCGKEHPVTIKQTGAPPAAKGESKQVSERQQDQSSTPFPSDLNDD